MKNFKKFMEDAPSMATTAVAGAGENPEKIVPVYTKKKRKKKKDEVPVLTRTEKKK